jgi:hypothetical protein
METQPDINVLIFLPSNFAVNRALDASLHEEQAVSIKCLRRIGELLDAHPNMNIRLLWLPRAIPSVGFKRAKQLALEAICTADLRDVEEPHSIKNQKQKTKQAAIATWLERWHEVPRSSLAYQTALTKPPDGRPHPTFLVRQEAVKFSRLTIQTIEHILLVCPLYTATHRKHLTANSRPRNLSQLFNHPERVTPLLRFLEETRACAKLRTE